MKLYNPFELNKLSIMFFFDKKVFFKYFVIILSTLVIVFNIAMIFFGYELMQFDIPGSIITAALLANLFMLLGKDQR